MAKIFELISPQEVTPLSSPALRLVFRFSLTHTQHYDGRQSLRGETVDWKQLLASITGTVDQELLLRNEYLVTENRILRNQITGRVRLTDGERKALAEIGQKLGKKALEAVANIVKPATILAWHRKLVAQKFDGSQHRQTPGCPTIAQELEALVVRMARENHTWGYDRIVGALANLGIRSVTRRWAIS
jgi:putative transposase